MILARLRGRGSVPMTWCVAASKAGHKNTPDDLVDLLACIHHLVRILYDAVRSRANAIIRIKDALARMHGTR